MAQQPTHDFTIPNPATVTVQGSDGKPKQIQVYDAITLGPALRTIKAALDSLAGRGTGPTQMTGPLTMNSNTIKGVVNSATPAPDEAVSFGLAQQQYTVFRPVVTTQTGSYQIKATDGTVRAKAGQVATNQTLPPASTVIGHCFTIRKVDPSANAVLVTTSRDPVTGVLDSIDGKPSYSLSAVNKYVTVQAMASGIYEIVGNN